MYLQGNEKRRDKKESLQERERGREEEGQGKGPES